MPRPGYEVLVTRIAKVPPERAFEVIVPCDLPTFFTGYGPLPKVKRVTDQTGDWDAAGQTRMIHLSDGSHTGEQINSYEPPGRFTYTVGPFSGLNAHIVDRAEGAFWFDANPEGTLVRWSYTWVPKRGRGFLLLPLTQLWKGYANRVLKKLVAAAEGRESD